MHSAIHLSYNQPQKMGDGQYCREDEESKTEMVWKWSETLWNEKIRRCGVVDIAEKMREARLRWYGHVIRRDEGDLVRDIME